MELKFDVLDDTLVVYFNGELDHHSSEEIREDIDNVIEDKNIKFLIFDLANLKFMDSSGIGVIIGRYKLMSKKKGKIAVTNVNNRIDKIFEISGIYKIINKYKDVHTALDNIKR